MGNKKSIVIRDGFTFKGNFTPNGDGYAKIYMPNGAIYKGDIKDFNPHGCGCCVWIDGNTYRGTWINGYKACGLFIWKQSGNTYKGQWFNDVKNGKGTYSVKEKKGLKIFQGIWTGDEDGSGTILFPTGYKYIGAWKNYFLDGHVLHISLDGNQKMMEYNDGKIVYKEISKIPDETSNVSEEQCLICCDNKKCIVFLPCKHLSLCGKCSVDLKQCPVCRSDINESMRIFI